MMSEKLLREWIRELLLTESGASDARLIQATAPQVGIKDIKTPSGVKYTGVGTKSGVPAHFRIHTKDTHSQSDTELKTKAKDLVTTVFNLDPATVTVQNMSMNISGTYNTYEVSGTDQNGEVQTKNIIFAALAAGGQRGGGYKYEEDTVKVLQSAGITVIQGTDPRYTDVVATCQGELGFELKAKGGKFGEPTLRYSYNAKMYPFSPSKASRSKKNALMISRLLNRAIRFNDPGIRAWMNKLNDGWAKYINNGKGFRGGIFSTQMSIDQYRIIKRKTLISQSAPKIEITPNILVDYYLEKKAEYIQILNKGLYHIGNNPLGLETLSFSDAIASLPTPTIKVQIMNSRNMVLRATLSLNYNQIPKSTFSLDDPEDVLTLAGKCIA